MQDNKLIIGIDIRPLATHHQYRGIGTYIKQLLCQLSKIDPKNKYCLFVDKNLSKPVLELDPGFNYQFIEVDRLPDSLKSRLMAAYHPLDWNTDSWEVDIFLQPDLSNGLPRGQAKKIAVFYDLIPFLFKKYYYPKRKVSKQWLVEELLWRAYVKTLKSYKKLDAVIAISESSRRDLLKSDSKLSANKIHAIYLGVSSAIKSNFRSTSVDSSDNPYFLYVGSCDWRKNVPALVEAFNSVRESKNCRLILVGKDIKEGSSPELNKAIAASPFKKDIVLTGFVDDRRLRHLYSSAEAFVFASLYEGMGLPVLEALAAGCPVISYDNSSIGEVTGDAVLSVNSPLEMAASMRKILEMDIASRKKIIAKGLKQAKRFSWHKTARETLSLFENI